MRYYYGQLSRPLQGVYDALLGGFRVLAPGIRIPMLDEKQLADVYLRLKLDEPLLFYVTGYRCRWMTGAAHMELLPEYLFDKAKIRTHQQAVSARLARLTKPLEGKTEAEKELAVHDFILENVRYDKLKKPYSHEILGPMTQGVGVCEGIAKTVKALCDQLGLWCIVALSEADPARGIKYRHTWNVVRVGGQYYHLDATFDNSLQRGEKRYDYYNLDDGRLFRDHTPLVLPVPACTDGKRFYYRSVSFTKPEELEKLGEDFWTQVGYLHIADPAGRRCLSQTTDADFRQYTQTAVRRAVNCRCIAVEADIEDILEEGPCCAQLLRMWIKETEVC